MAQPWPLGTKGKFAKTRVRRGQTEEEDMVLFFDQKTSEKSYPFSAFFFKKKNVYVQLFRYYAKKFGSDDAIVEG